MSVLCLTGWQQPADALSDMVPDAEHFDYASYDNTAAMFAALPTSPRVAIGWSLGGQLLARAIAAGHTRPEMLILLSAPFQWVADERFPQGFPAAAAGGVRDNYLHDPQAMLKNLNSLIGLGDAHEKRIARLLNATLAVWPNGIHWFDELASASCGALDFQDFPPTLILHGLNDHVIRFANAQAFVSRLPQAQLLLWPQCAHAPHLHDPQALRDLLSDIL